jgi:hypothetical protein
LGACPLEGGAAFGLGAPVPVGADTFGPSPLLGLGT